MQHLAEPLQKHLIKLVNKEADEEWAKTPAPEIPKCAIMKVTKNSAGWYNFVANIIRELKP